MPLLDPEVSTLFGGRYGGTLLYCRISATFYSKKLDCSKPTLVMNTLARNKRIIPDSVLLVRLHQVMINSDCRGICIPAVEVKCFDYWNTNSRESVCQGLFH